MKVEVLMSSYFNKYLKHKPDRIYSLPCEIKNVKELIFYLGLPESEVGFTVINGIRRESDFTLSEGDVISIFPYIIGG